MLGWLVDVVLLGIVTWSAIAAGASFQVAKADQSYKKNAIARIGIAILAGVAILVRHMP